MADNLYSPIVAVIRMIDSMSDTPSTPAFRSQCKDALGDFNLVKLEVCDFRPTFKVSLRWG